MNYYEMTENVTKLAFAETPAEKEVYFKKCMEMLDDAKFCNLMKIMSSKKKEAN